MPWLPTAGIFVKQVVSCYRYSMFRQAGAHELYPTPDQLEANALAYPVMQQEVSSRDERLIADIAHELLRIPLTHGTNMPDDAEIMLRNGVQASGLHAEIAHAWSFPLDISLGLNNYVFMNWGIPDGNYGRHHVLVAARALLHQDTIVTPTDITKQSTSLSDRDNIYAKLDPDRQAHIKAHYFGRMVTGAAWLEIAARNVYRHKQANPDQPYPVLTVAGMGEIKRFGAIAAHEITGRYTLTAETKSRPSSFAQWQQEMLKRGIKISTETPHEYRQVPQKGTICACVTHPFMQ